MRGNTAAVPASLLSPFGSYPNVLGLTDFHRERCFRPVVSFPEPPVVVDYTASSSATGDSSSSAAALSAMLTPQEWEALKRRRTAENETMGATAPGSPSSSDGGLMLPPAPGKNPAAWTLGRYDEDRRGMYESEMFRDAARSIDSYRGRRTLHVGIDLGGPAGTPVRSFWHGTVHAAGYNPDLGDYGHVVVVRYARGGLPSPDEGGRGRRSGSDDEEGVPQFFYALYGHLDSSALRWKPGDAVQAGQALAGMGSPGENGGWRVPHVHFQLSATAPSTYDMPGAVSLQDRDRALLEYPDPRYVLGPLY
jgi:murein DD-endopeptidase MepM/ murein hydrolase activator NlpD